MTALHSCVQHIARKRKFGVATPEIEARVPQFRHEQARSCVTVPRQIARQMLNETALQLAAPGKGILASDESTGTIGKRLERAGLQNDEVLWHATQLGTRHRGSQVGQSDFLCSCHRPRGETTASFSIRPQTLVPPFQASSCSRKRCTRARRAGSPLWSVYRTKASCLASRLGKRSDEPCIQ